MTQPIRWLQDEIAERMLQKLDIVKLQVKDALIVPNFPGKHLHAFAKRFPGVCIHSIREQNVTRFQMWKAYAFASWRSLFCSAPKGAIESYLATGKFPLPDNSVDLVFSNLLLQDLIDPKHFLQECWRVLREGGLISFSYLGPDTGKELRQLKLGALQVSNLNSPWDMHDMGDALMSERFSDPVMDMEHLTLDYEKPSLLVADVAGLKMLQAAPEDLEILNLPKKLTLEVVYGHAWAIGKHLAKSQDHIAYIDLNQIGRKTRRDSA